MKFLHTTFEWLTKNRSLEIEKLKSNPIPVQEKVFHNLILEAKDTEWGKRYNYQSILTVEDFQQRVPISYYEDLYPHISRMMNGEENILWPSKISWFSKSSGTTNDRSKFIPVSQESLDECNFKGGKDELILYIKNNPNSKVLSGKTLGVGGSIVPATEDDTIFCGDISAVIMKNLPFWAQYLRTPSLQTALMSEWEEKIEKMAREASRENVTAIAGVPTWTSLLLRKVLEVTGAENIFEVWPNLEVFFHGAVSFAPYKKLFEELLPSPNMKYMEVYNASEGLFAIQDDMTREGEMMLMPDYGVFYEFILVSDLGMQNPKVYTFADVQMGENYALVISTNAGLWRYIIGDTVMFTTLYPHRIKITGRTKHFINAFGEEVLVHNTDQALTETSVQTGAIVSEYTVAPIFMEGNNRGSHEWVIEFEREPDAVEDFVKILDASLRSLNSDYDAKRYKDMALSMPTIHCVPKGTFYVWMKSRGKLGGQHKVPRLSNSREYVEDILRIKSS